MTINGVEGLSADPPEPVAANEEFAGINDEERLGRAQSGWDPYDVWRTRVKNSAEAKEREADPRR